MAAACILCGVGLSFSRPEQWLREFRAVYIQDDCWNEVKLSGVGYRLGENFIAPVNPQKRYDDNDLTEKSTISLLLNRATYSENITDMRFAPRGFWGFGFHSACWNIFTKVWSSDLGALFVACLSFPVVESGVLRWGHGYNGVPRYNTLDGDDSMVPYPLRNRLPSFTDFLPDPLNIPGLDDKLKGSLPPKIYSSPGPLHGVDMARDPFSVLPLDILYCILVALPTEDARSLWVASPTFATLKQSEKFWGSRFKEPHEHQYFFEAFADPPRSWQAFYLLVENWAPAIPSIKNRKRIWRLARLLRGLLNQIREASCQGYPLRSFLTPRSATSLLGWYSCDNRVDDNLECLRTQELSLSGVSGAKWLSVSFINFNGRKFISGLRFVKDNGQCECLGYIHPLEEVHRILNPTQSIKGWILSGNDSGFGAIATVYDDNEKLEWIGDSSQFITWYIGGEGNVTAMKAEFDGFRMISLGRDAPDVPSTHVIWPTRQPWKPEAPPSDVFLHCNSRVMHPRGRRCTYSYTLFGGLHGEDLAQLTGVNVWSYDRETIIGIQFIFTDSSKNKSFGDIDSLKTSLKSELYLEYSHSMAIDGPAGEIITGIEVKDKYGRLGGLKIETNLGRESCYPYPPWHDDHDEWISIKPNGSKVIGVWGRIGYLLDSIGLISKTWNKTLKEYKSLPSSDALLETKERLRS